MYVCVHQLFRNYHDVPKMNASSSTSFLFFRGGGYFLSRKNPLSSFWRFPLSLAQFVMKDVRFVYLTFKRHLHKQKENKQLGIPSNPRDLSVSICRVEICRNRHDRRSCKICASCVNFPRKQRDFLHICAELQDLHTQSVILHWNC